MTDILSAKKASSITPSDEETSLLPKKDHSKRVKAYQIPQKPTKSKSDFDITDLVPPGIATMAELQKLFQEKRRELKALPPKTHCEASNQGKSLIFFTSSCFRLNKSHGSKFRLVFSCDWFRR